LLESDQIEVERCELLQLPPDLLEKGELYEDYVFMTDSNHIVVDLALTALFSLNAIKPSAEPAPALLQLTEHLIGSVRQHEQVIHLLDRQLTELAERIARAYGCEALWHEF